MQTDCEPATYKTRREIRSEVASYLRTLPLALLYGWLHKNIAHITDGRRPHTYLLIKTSREALSQAEADLRDSFTAAGDRFHVVRSRGEAEAALRDLVARVS